MVQILVVILAVASIAPLAVVARPLPASGDTLPHNSKFIAPSQLVDNSISDAHDRAKTSFNSLTLPPPRTGFERVEVIPPHELIGAQGPGHEQTTQAGKSTAPVKAKGAQSNISKARASSSIKGSAKSTLLMDTPQDRAKKAATRKESGRHCTTCGQKGHNRASPHDENGVFIPRIKTG